MLALSPDEEVDVCAGYDIRSRSSSAGIPLHDALNTARELTFSAAQNSRCATTRTINATTSLLTLEGTAGTRGSIVGHEEGIEVSTSDDAYVSTPISTYMSAVLPCRLVQRRARATVSHFLIWVPELACIFAALATHTYR